MVGSVAQHDFVDIRPLEPLPEAFRQRTHPCLGVVRTRDIREVAVIGEELERPHRAPIRRYPPKREADIVHLVAKPAREQKAVDPKACQNLGQLQWMAEAVGKVTSSRRLTAEPLADGTADQKVAHKRLAADQELIRQHVARTNLDPAHRDQRPQPRLVLGPDRDVVLQHDRLPVERERSELQVTLERVKHLVNHAPEHQPEVFERAIPLAIPVGVRHDEVALNRPEHLNPRAYAPASGRRRLLGAICDDVESGLEVVASLRSLLNRC